MEKTINISDISTEAFAEVYKYQTEISNPDYDPTDESLEMIPNTQTKDEFLIECFENHAKQVCEQYSLNKFDKGELTTEDYQLGKEEYKKKVQIELSI